MTTDTDTDLLEQKATGMVRCQNDECHYFNKDQPRAPNGNCRLCNQPIVQTETAATSSAASQTQPDKPRRFSSTNDLQIRLTKLTTTNIPFFRKAKQLSVKELAEKCKLASTVARNIENGNQLPLAGTIQKLCSGLELTPGELLAVRPEKRTEDELPLMQKILQPIAQALSPEELGALVTVVANATRIEQLASGKNLAGFKLILPMDPQGQHSGWSVGATVRSCRAASGVQASEICKQIDKHFDFLNLLEKPNNEQHLDALALIAEFFEVELWQLLSDPQQQFIYHMLRVYRLVGAQLKEVLRRQTKEKVKLG